MPGLVLFHVLMRNLDADEIRRFSEVEGLTKESVAEVTRLQMVDSRIEVGHPYDAKSIPSSVLVELAQHILKSGRADAEDKGVTKITTAMGDGDPAARILACAQQEGCRLHHHGQPRSEQHPGAAGGERFAQG